MRSFIKYIFFIFITSCRYESNNLNIVDFNKDFFNLSLSIKFVKNRYPMFFDTSISNSFWEKKRRDKCKINLYKLSLRNFNLCINKYFFRELISKVRKELKIDKIYIYKYSSGMENIYDPIIFVKNKNYLFIDMDSYLGSKNDIYNYFNILPSKISRTDFEFIYSDILDSILEKYIYIHNNATFIETCISEGKKIFCKLILSDFKISEDILLNYTNDYLSWCKKNEKNIWNYFLYNNLLFSNDSYIKYNYIYNNVTKDFDNKDGNIIPSKIGIWIGYKIVKNYYLSNKIKLLDLINKRNIDVFLQSKYKP